MRFIVAEKLLFFLLKFTNNCFPNWTHDVFLLFFLEFKFLISKNWANFVQQNLLPICTRYQIKLNYEMILLDKCLKSFNNFFFLWFHHSSEKQYNNIAALSTLFFMLLFNLRNYKEKHNKKKVLLAIQANCWD